jgi:hypothetical protein
MPKSMYTRLTGRRRSIAGFSQLWLAPDHILLVTSTRFTENYQRFALADIQSIVATEIPEQPWFQILVAAAILSGTVWFFTASMLFTKILSAAIALLSLAVMIRNIAAGARCRCELITAITRQHLAPVSRIRSARKFLATIRPLIESVQGSLDPERASAVTLPRESIEKPPEIELAPTYLPEWLFGLFLVNAVLVIASVLLPKAPIANVLMTTMFGEICIAVAALIRRSGRDKRQLTYVVILAGIACALWDGFTLAGSVVGWMNGVVETARRGATTQPSILQAFAFSQGAARFAAIWRIAAGSLGFLTAWLERQ